MNTTQQAEALPALIERFRGLHFDHAPDGWPAVRTREITALLDRITELEAQLAQRFDAADMATAAAQGFRDGATATAQPVAERHYGPLRDADAEYGQQLSVYSTPKSQPVAEPAKSASQPAPQQEAQEPVAVVVPCYTPSGKRVALYSAKQDLPIGTQLYTAPQPSPTAQAAESVQEDAARLDYLHSTGSTIEMLPGEVDFYPMRFRVGGLRSAVSPNLREAIDAARKQGKQ